MLKYINIKIILASSILLGACTDQEKFANIGLHENTRWEFAPNMYHSKAYEPLTQVMDVSAGSFVSSDEDGVGEYYNSNPLNPFEMNMREPAPNTVKWNNYGYMPYRISKDSLEFASKTLVNPLDTSVVTIQQGEVLYIKFCAHCHGAQGKGDGPVNKAFKGVANLAEGQLKDISMGHVFHVITHGKGRMLAHKSQLNQEERWKIALYVKKNIQTAQ